MSQRLLARTRGFLRFSELWVDEHQLISRVSRRVQEHYQRFSLDQIQAIVVTPLPHWTVAHFAALAGTLSLALLPLLSRGSSPTVKAIAMALLGWPLLLVLIHILRGPRCRVVVHTAAGSQLLPAISRMRRAAPVLAELQSLIESVQGRLEDFVPSTGPAGNRPARIAALHDALAPLRYTVFGTLALGVLLTVAELLPSKLKDALMGVELMQAGAELLLAAILWQRTSPLLRSTGAGLVTAITFGLIILDILLSIALAIIRFPSTTPPREDPLFRACMFFGIFWRIAMIVWGIVETRRTPWNRQEDEALS